MEQLKNDANKNDLYQQFLVKIRNAENDRRAEDREFMNRVRSVIENKKSTKSLTQK